MIKKIVITSLVAASILPANDLGIASHAELGYVGTSGNTKTETFSFDGSVQKQLNEHIFTIKANGAYVTNDDIVSKEKVATELTYDYKFTQTFTFDYTVGYKKDSFSGYKYEAFTGPGMKYFALNNEQQNLNFTLSALYYRQKPDISKLEEYSLAKVQGEYSHKLSDTLKFIQELSYSTAFEDTDTYFIDSKSALTSKISDILSAGLSYKINYVNLVPVGIQHNDTTLALNMIIDY